MKILVVADDESKSLWDFYTPRKLKGIDLIISCGDLSPDYLEFLVTMSNRTLLYVRGNHDTVYDRKPPGGCVCIDEMIYNHNGLRIAGLGGSMRYKESSDMYTESEMTSRVSRLMRRHRSPGESMFLWLTRRSGAMAIWTICRTEDFNVLTVFSAQ